MQGGDIIMRDIRQCPFAQMRGDVLRKQPAIFAAGGGLELVDVFGLEHGPDGINRLVRPCPALFFYRIDAGGDFGKNLPRFLSGFFRRPRCAMPANGDDLLPAVEAGLDDVGPGLNKMSSDF
jgi:hypothetical protein